MTASSPLPGRVPPQLLATFHQSMPVLFQIMVAAEAVEGRTSGPAKANSRPAKVAADIFMGEARTTASSTCKLLEIQPYRPSSDYEVSSRARACSGRAALWTRPMPSSHPLSRLPIAGLLAVVALALGWLLLVFAGERGGRHPVPEH